MIASIGRTHGGISVGSGPVNVVVVVRFGLFVVVVGLVVVVVFFVVVVNLVVTVLAVLAGLVVDVGFVVCFVVVGVGGGPSSSINKIL